MGEKPDDTSHYSPNLTNAKRLRIAAENIESSRSALEWGDIEFHGPDDVIGETPEKIDDVLDGMAETLREIAVHEEVAEEMEDDD